MVGVDVLGSDDVPVGPPADHFDGFVLLPDLFGREMDLFKR